MSDDAQRKADEAAAPVDFRTLVMTALCDNDIEYDMLARHVANAGNEPAQFFPERAVQALLDIVNGCAHARAASPYQDATSAKREVWAEVLGFVDDDSDADAHGQEILGRIIDAGAKFMKATRASHPATPAAVPQRSYEDGLIEAAALCERAEAKALLAANRAADGTFGHKGALMAADALSTLGSKLESLAGAPAAVEPAEQPQREAPAKKVITP